MVVIGGLTRLTRSGLSMTEWRFGGERPPLTDADWAAEFERYRASPEFRKVRGRLGLRVAA
jgi:cytochrome c oxidase assembly protein subunit 15